MKKQAAITSVMLSVLFVVVYGACNHLTAMRADVGTFYFEWEKEIPFVQLMFVPYMSIDLFFIVCPFLCTTPRELGTYRRRITACIFIAAMAFLLVPLRDTFDRPVLPGFFGDVYNQFKNMDLPYNEFPSLHIALRAVMVSVYLRHAPVQKRWMRWAIHVWFSLIGLSTLMVFQHHLIDIAGGFVLAAAVYCLFQENPPPVSRNVRVGLYYLAGGMGLLMVAVLSRHVLIGGNPWGILLTWPACSLAVVAAGYLRLGAGIYRKQISGYRVGNWAWLALWPVLLGQYLSLKHYARRGRAWDHLTDRVWFGRRLSASQALGARHAGVRAVLDLTAEFTEPSNFRKGPYLNILVLDLTAPTQGQLREAIDFIDEEQAHGVVYIHCKIGYSRSAAVAGAWLIHSGLAANAEGALALLRKARPDIIIRPEAVRAIEAFVPAAKV